MFRKNKQKSSKNQKESSNSQQQQQQPTAPTVGVAPDAKITNSNNQRVQNGNGNQAGNKGTALTFHCQLAHGSPTVFVSGFANVRELYAKIAQEFDIPPTEILFCTLNTYKLDMKNLLASQIGLDDFIFAHRKGRPKEVELIKSEEALGLTITDNGAGYAFIKRIKDGSVIDRIEHIKVGDHIEKLNDMNMIGKRHHEVARTLKELPVGAKFTIRLIEPMTSSFNAISPTKTGKYSNKKGMGTGRETLRFKADGNVAVEEKDDNMELGIEKINEILENFLGINDSELATQIWDKSEGKSNSMDFAEAIDNSDLEELGFTDDLIIEIWGAITDARSVV